MKPTNLVNIDFDDIKESIKSYLRTRSEFSDYDFTGSTLSYMVDVLAYNTYYSAFNANMALNELFLDTASIRDNVVSLAKSLNYVPKSISAAKACIILAAQTQLGVDGSYPSLATLRKGDVAIGSVDGTSYTFVVLDDKIASVDRSTGVALFDSLKIYEGTLLSNQYIVDTTTQQHFIIPNDSVDTETIKVFVKTDQQSTTYDRYSMVSNVTSVTSSDKIFFLSETEDRRYELTFGDGIIGRKLIDNEVVYFEYIKTNGAAGNNINSMGYIGQIVDSNNQIITNVTLLLTDKSQLGGAAEGMASIKFNAPKYYSAQNRAVTSNDYESIIRSIYPNAKYVNAFGGELLNPPVYGKVYIAIKTQTGNNLNNLTKQDIVSKIRPYSMASIETVIIDPDEFFINLNLFVAATTFKSVLSSSDQNLSQNTSDDIKKKILAAIQEYGTNQDLGNFGKVLSLSQIEKVVIESDPNITDVQFGITPYKQIPYENITSPKSWTFDFDVKLNCSCDSAAGETVRSSVFYTPDISEPQYLQDDGAGKLISYYIENNKKVITNNNAGTYDCDRGKVVVGPITTVYEPFAGIPVTPGTGGTGTGTGTGGTGTGAVPSFLIISINPSNPNTIAIPPGSILTIPIPNITIGSGIPTTGPGSSAGNPNTFVAQPAAFNFQSPVSTSLGNSCFS